MAGRAMKHLGGICVVGLLLLGASPFDAISSAAAGAPETGVAPARDDATVRKPQSAGGNPLWGIPMERLSATRDRPIFSLSRRPPPPVSALDVAATDTAASAPRPPERPSLAL